MQSTEKTDAILEAMAQDAVKQCMRYHSPRFMGFLNEREQAFIRTLAERKKWENYMFWGGYAEAERVVFGVFPDYLPASAAEFPLQSVTALFRAQDALGHRDFLGALLSLGIERSTVGDLLTEQGRAVLFLRTEITPYVLSQLEKVGSCGVQLMQTVTEPLPLLRQVKLRSVVVASLRTDCIVAACVGESREKAKHRIEAGLVQVNHFPCLSPSDLLQAGDQLSIRGVGRFRLAEIGSVTKKGRIAVTVQKYLS